MEVVSALFAEMKGKNLRRCLFVTDVNLPFIRPVISLHSAMRAGRAGEHFDHLSIQTWICSRGPWHCGRCLQVDNQSLAKAEYNKLVEIVILT